MMNDQQIFAGTAGIRQIMVAVLRPACARRIRTLHFAYFDRRLQMRLQHRHLGVERSLDLGELDLPLRLDVEMDRVVLRLPSVVLGFAESGDPRTTKLYCHPSGSSVREPMNSFNVGARNSTYRSSSP